MQRNIKKHWALKAIIIGIVIVLFIVTLVISCNYILKLDSPSVLLSNMYNFSGLFIAIVALLNLYLVYFFYCENSKSKVRELKVQSKLYWYRTIIIEKNIQLLEDFFENGLNTVELCKVLFCGKDKGAFEEVNKKAKELIGNYTDAKMSVDRNLTDIIKAVDSEFGNDIDQMIMDFQDEFTKSISQAMLATEDYNYTTIEDLISRQKRTMYSKLYTYEISKCIEL